MSTASARCGSRATSGTVPFTPGRNIATAAPAAAAMATSSQNGGRPAKNATAGTPWVSTIARRVGLSSAVNLRRRFHEALRTTPAAYRRSFRADRAG